LSKYACWENDPHREKKSSKTNRHCDLSRHLSDHPTLSFAASASK
jgi:hypothetical protein